MKKKRFGFLAWFLVFAAFSVYAGGNKEIQGFSIQYKDGVSGIKCIDPEILTPSQIKSELAVVAYTEDGEEEIDLTEDISIEKSGSRWIAFYEYKTGVWIFGSKETISVPILVNPLKSLTVVYPDFDSTCLRINQSNITNSDVKRLKIQALFFSGELEDVTKNCIISIADPQSIEVTYELKGQSYKDSFDLNLDKLVNLEVTRKDPSGSILPNYPIPTGEEIERNVVVQAVYSSGTRTNVTDSSGYQIQGKNIQVYYGDQSAEIPLDILTELVASTSSGKKIKVVSFSSVHEADIRDNLQVIAYYSNGFQSDVTDEIEISVSDSNVFMKYGDITVGGDFLVECGLQSWMILLLLISILAALVVSAILHYKKAVSLEKQFLKRLSEIDKMESL